MWYSFDYGPVHGIMVNTETDFADAPDGPGTTLNVDNFVGTAGQLAWLKTDLKPAITLERRAKVPWIVVAGHRPFFASTVKAQVQLARQPIIPASSTCKACRASFLPLTAQHKVDFYFSAHVHWMELLYPLNETGEMVAKRFSNVDGIIHVTDGAGGAPIRAETVETVDTARQAWFFDGYGFYQLVVKDPSHATLNFIDSSTQKVIKSVDVVRNH